MTPQPQQEYIITEDELKWYDEHVSFHQHERAIKIRSRPAPSPTLEKVLLCFGNYWDCPIDEEECKVSDACHQKAICDREHDATTRNQTLRKILPTDEELHALKHVICEAIQNKVEGCSVADNYYHKLKTLRREVPA